MNRQKISSLLRRYRNQCRSATGGNLTQEKISELLDFADSTYGQWERVGSPHQNDRLPKTRDTVVRLIEVFRKYGGVKNIEEANELLALMDFSAIQEDEMNQLGFSPVELKHMSCCGR